MAEGRITMLMQDVINKVKEISEISGYISVVRKPFFSLAGRLTIMIPFFQEIRDVTKHASRNLYEAMTSLLDHLEATKKLLQQGSKGSKIYVVLEREEIMREYETVVAELEEDLRRICFEKLDVSDEVKEQADLVLRQFDRARGKQFDTSADDDLYEDLLFLYHKGSNGVLDPEVFNGVVETLGLTKATALEQESVALSEIVIARGGDRVENIEKMFMVLKHIKDFLHTNNQSVDSSSGDGYVYVRQGIANVINYDNEVIPNEFLCPISLQLMQDPVVISTGQTFERLSIQTWIQAGNGTCPTTRQFLTNTTLIPNYALRDLIVEWCKTNRILDAPKGVSTIAYSCNPVERKFIGIYIRQLECVEHNGHQRKGAGEIYQLTKRNAQIREAIGEAGAIPSLIKALQTTDPETQGYAMSALLNLSICPRNKRRIVEAGAIPKIIDAMNSGSMKVCEDGATILFSLSETDEIRFLIGSHEGIRPLVFLLREGSERGQKDAATALFSLCLIPCNIARAVKFGVVPVLIARLLKGYSPLKDDALALLDMMVSHRDVKLVLLKESPTQRLIQLLLEGSRKNQENAASILLQLSVEDPKYLDEAQRFRIVNYLMYVECFGSEEGKRKANLLLQR
ncbi:Armadillo, partial [Cynara cardunculus var. scolymus]